MSKFNKWIEPYRRSFASIKGKLLANLDQIKDPNDSSKNLITDKSEGNILVWILSQLAAIAEGLHYYIDQTARETFLSTARRYDSLRKHADLVDYSPKGSLPAMVDVTLSRSSSDSLPQINLEVDSVLSDTEGNEWRLLTSRVFPLNATIAQVTLVQCSAQQTMTYSGTDLIDSRYIFLDNFSSSNLYMEGSMEVKVGDEDWALVETFAKSSPQDTHFKVEVWNLSRVVLVFGDGVNGQMPSSSETIQCTFRTTNGADGNIEVGSIDTTWPDNSDITVRNSIAAGGGSNYEDTETLRRRIPLSIKTLDVAISKEDFKDLAMTRPGVGQVAIEYECGRKLNVYLATTDGNPASSGLCEDVKNYLLQHCPLTTWLDVKSVGKTSICLDIEVTGHKSYKTNYIYNQVVEALTNKYSAANAEIGGSVRLSDIYALIDNLSSVDYLRVNKFYLKPWPKVLRGIQLELGTYNLIQCDQNMTYIMEYQGDNAFNVYSQYNGFMQKITGTSTSGSDSTDEDTGLSLVVNDTINGINFSLIIENSEVLQTGYKYSLYITQNSLDYEEPGYNIPSFEESDLVLTVNEVL